jgi:hypothetical protein
MACLIASASCVDHSCTEIGAICGTTTITLQSPNDALEPGTYDLALSLDGKPAQCTVAIPDPPPLDGVQGNCGGTALTLTMAPVESCPPVVCDGTACEGMSCTPIAGHFQMTLVIQGVPAEVGLDLSVDGNEVMNETIAPNVMTTEPNGAGCGTCSNASAALSITND